MRWALVVGCLKRCGHNKETMTKPKEKQGTLMEPPKGKYKQQDITGTKVLKETTPKDVQDAAGYYFSKKKDFACAKSNVEKAANELLAVMGKHKITLAKVYDQDEGPKRIVIKSGSERLKVENDVG